MTRSIVPVPTAELGIRHSFDMLIELALQDSKEVSFMVVADSEQLCLRDPPRNSGPRPTVA